MVMGLGHIITWACELLGWECVREGVKYNGETALSCNTVLCMLATRSTATADVTHQRHVVEESKPLSGWQGEYHLAEADLVTRGRISRWKTRTFMLWRVTLYLRFYRRKSWWNLLDGEWRRPMMLRKDRSTAYPTERNDIGIEKELNLYITLNLHYIKIYFISY